MGERDWVEVVFHAATPYEEAEARVRRAVEAAGLPVGGVCRDDEREDVLELEIATIVGERTGFFARSIAGDVLRALDVFDNRRVTVEVPRAAAVDGGVPEVETALSHRTLAPRPLAAISYRVQVWRALVASLSLVQEKRADAFAARAVGKDATRRALSRLAEVNQMKRGTGLLMNLLSLHPSVEQRLEALDDDGGGATPGRAAST